MCANEWSGQHYAYAGVTMEWQEAANCQFADNIETKELTDKSFNLR